MLFLVIVGYDLISALVEFSDDVYLKMYYVANELVSTSLNVFILLVCYKMKLCWYNKVAVFGMLSLNLVNFIALLTPLGHENYYATVTHVVMIPTAILAVILLIKKL